MPDGGFIWITGDQELYDLRDINKLRPIVYIIWIAKYIIFRRDILIGIKFN